MELRAVVENRSVILVTLILHVFANLNPSGGAIKVVTERLDLKISELKVQNSLSNLTYNPRLSTDCSDVVIQKDLEKVPTEMLSIFGRGGVGFTRLESLLENIIAGTAHEPATLFPIHFAALLGEVDKLEEIILSKSGAVSTKSCIDEWSPLHIAALSDIECVKSLIEGGANLDAVEEITLDTALHYASLAGRVDTVRLLLASGADANMKNSKGMTPLTYAAWGGSESIAREVYFAGAEINVEDSDNLKPIHMAISENDFRMILALREFGANLDYRDSSGAPTCVSIGNDLKRCITSNYGAYMLTPWIPSASCYAEVQRYRECLGSPHTYDTIVDRGAGSTYQYILGSMLILGSAVIVCYCIIVKHKTPRMTFPSVKTAPEVKSPEVTSRTKGSRSRFPSLFKRK